MNPPRFSPPSPISSTSSLPPLPVRLVPVRLVKATVSLSLITGLSITLLWNSAGCGGIHSDQPDASMASDGGNDASTGADAAIASYNGALRFDGVNDVVRIKTRDEMNSTALTIEAWVYPNQLRSGAIAGRWQNGRNRLWNVAISDGGVDASIQTGSGSLGTAFAPMKANAWHHVAMVIDKKTVQIIIDGKDSAISTLPGIPASNNLVDLMLGRNEGTPQPVALNGLLDEVRLWNRALSLAEIQDNRSTEIDPKTSGLIGYWRFNEPTDEQLVFDLGPNQLKGWLGVETSQQADDPERVVSTAPIASLLDSPES